MGDVSQRSAPASKAAGPFFAKSLHSRGFPSVASYEFQRAAARLTGLLVNLVVKLKRRPYLAAKVLD